MTYASYSSGIVTQCCIDLKSLCHNETTKTFQSKTATFPLKYSIKLEKVLHSNKLDHVIFVQSSNTI